MDKTQNFGLKLYYTYMNEDQIDRELICMICNEPFQSPVNCTQCGQTLCEQCNDIWNETNLSCPLCRKENSQYVPVISRIVINQLNRLLVKCPLCQQINIERGNFSDHMTCTCPKQMVLCSEKCGWKGFRENLQCHLTKCRKSPRLFKFLGRLQGFACIFSSNST